MTEQNAHPENLDNLVNRLQSFEGTIVLCGSTRFHRDYQDANRMLTLWGNVVTSCGHFGNSIHAHLDNPVLNKRCKILHFQKVTEANLVCVVRPDYRGKSTVAEINWATWLGIPIIGFTAGIEDDPGRFRLIEGTRLENIQPIGNLTRFSQDSMFKTFADIVGLGFDYE